MAGHAPGARLHRRPTARRAAPGAGRVNGVGDRTRHSADHPGSGVLVRHPVDHRICARGSAADRGYRARRRARCRLGDHGVADAERSAGLHRSARCARVGCPDRGRLEGRPARVRKTGAAGLAHRCGAAGADRDGRSACAVVRSRCGIPGRALGDHARTFRHHRLILRTAQPGPAVAALPAQCRGGRGGNRGGFQRSYRLCHLQCVHRLRWRYPGVTDSGGSADSAAGAGVGGAVDRRCGCRGGTRSAVRATSTADVHRIHQVDDGIAAGCGEPGRADTRRRRGVGQLRQCRSRSGDVGAGIVLLVLRDRRSDGGDGRRYQPAAQSGGHVIGTRTRRCRRSVRADD